MKKKMMFVVLLVLVFFAVIYRRYYFYNTSNVRFQEAINEHLEYYYENKEITCIDKKMNVTKEDNGLYRFEYIATMTDGEIVFEAIDNMYDKKRIGGHLFKEDYWEVRDNYIRKKLESIGISLQPYENDFREAVANNEPDYRFVVSESGDEEVIELITQVMSYGMENYKLDLWFEVYDENGEKITDSYALRKECERNKVAEAELKAFIKDRLIME